MLKLKEKIFGDVGFSSDLKLSTNELDIFRHIVSEHWLSVISHHYPELRDEAIRVGIENYHQFSHQIDHSKLWSKYNRILPPSSVQQIKQLPFYSTLKAEFGEFTISDAVHTKQEQGREEIYWRLVRPHVESDIGPLHKDKWFHDAFNEGYGMFPEGTITVKVWIPLYCEVGKSGLAILPGSHFKTWKYHIEVIDDVPKPRLDEKVNADLIPTEPGNMLIFNENILHGGVPNISNKTRVSAEITMIFREEDIQNHHNIEQVA
jgi:hypothetical protein